MTDDLKQKFEQLVADPPPPSTVPSQAVFARVRTVRRRRTAAHHQGVERPHRIP